MDSRSLVGHSDDGGRRDRDLSAKSPVMNALVKAHRAEAPPGFERIALLLQGGGALGAYQAGVYQALA
jgi:NTE family protein